MSSKKLFAIFRVMFSQSNKILETHTTSEPGLLSHNILLRNRGGGGRAAEFLSMSQHKLKTPRIKVLCVSSDQPDNYLILNVPRMLLSPCTTM